MVYRNVGVAVAQQPRYRFSLPSLQQWQHRGWRRPLQIGMRLTVAIALLSLTSSFNKGLPCSPVRPARAAFSSSPWLGTACSARQKSTGMAAEAGLGNGALPTDKVYLVTGSTDGIGKYTAQRLAERRDAVVLVHGRNSERVRKTVAGLKKRTGSSKVHGFVADVSIMSEVRRLAGEVQKQFPRLHGLLNNAGTFDGDYTGKKVVTQEGNEYSLAVNVMAPFLLTSLLLQNVRSSGAGRVLITSSMSAGNQHSLNDLQLQKGYGAHEAYSLSKLCDAMIAMELHHRYGDPPRLCFHTLDPDPTSSWIDTKMLRAGWSSGGNPVSRATASFQMLTEDKYGRESGIAWGCTPGGGAAARKKLWADLVLLTDAEWP